MGLTLHLTPGDMELMAPVLTLWQCYKVVMPHFISHWSYCLCYESAYSFLKYLSFPTAYSLHSTGFYLSFPTVHSLHSTGLAFL